MLFNFRAILQNSWAEVMDLILKPRSGGENKNNLKEKKKRNIWLDSHEIALNKSIGANYHHYFKIFASLFLYKSYVYIRDL